ncbi:hypothetical protein Lesp02_43300 [Lentzea sp. NBRC 105346]|uniref:hypothetical protein n=1 Tax=Lentzea sp. NBRC 105346 TaxID=3032205 RepID=UPI0024A2936C|nr:hypothetical protein [Lentzea sp. NBRC 105346]GLZ32142.1 hypothetical protein Lesp02_43300 [Lentzea sp. NBRC 105346]
MPAIEFMASTPVMGQAVGDVVGSGISSLVGTSQTKFSIDPAEAQKLIDGLNKAKEELLKLYDDAMDIANVNSPGKDLYSGFATIAIRQAAGEQEGGYRWANRQARDALDQTILSIQDALKVYRETEANNTAVF